MVASWGKRRVPVGSGMGSRNALRLDHLASFPYLSLLPNCICNAVRYLMLNLLIPHVTVIMSFPTFHIIECQWPHQQNSRCQLSFGRLAHQEAKYWQNVFCYCCAFTYLLLPVFSGICHVGNGCQVIPTALNVVWLSHGNVLFYAAFLPIDYYKYDFLLSHTV